MSDTATLTPIPPPPALPPTPLDPATEDAIVRELSEARSQHTALSKRIAILTERLGSQPGARWGPCTRCDYTWRGRWPHTPPRGCPRCGSTGWRVPPGNRINARRPGDPPGSRWRSRSASRSAQKSNSKRPARPRVPYAERPGSLPLDPFTGLAEPIRLTPPPKPPSLVPDLNIRFAEPEPVQPERLSRPQPVADAGEILIEFIEGDGTVGGDDGGSYNFIPEPEITRERASQIDSRWLVWQPALIMEARKGTNPTTRLAELRTCHRSRCISCQSAGLKWRVILRHSLDNPLWSPELFEFQLQAALKRSAARPCKHNVAKRGANYKMRLRS